MSILRGMGESTFTNHLLIAMPSLSDPNFSQAVTLVCEHTDKGALGIVLMLKVSIDLSFGRSPPQLIRQCMELFGRVLAFAQPVTGKGGCLNIGCLKIFAFGNAERDVMAPKRLEDFVAEP